MVELTLIAGVAHTGAIGDGETIPWHYDADEKQYKDRVSGYPVIVGRKTHEGMSRIEGTHPIVLTRSPPEDGEPDVSYASSVPEAVEAAAAHGDQGYVIGGQSVYSLFLPYADRAFVSELPEFENGSRVFPYLGTDWQIAERHEYDEFDVIEYEQASPRPPEAADE